MRARTEGFSLIEIAIVLVVIGLLLGGILKGQELIAGARVRALIKQQDGIRSAYYGFFDRFRALPGDYANATATITGVSTASCNGGNGDGDGRIEAAGHEHTLVWEHLARAGFLSGEFTCAETASPATSPTNPAGRPMEIVFDDAYAGSAASPRHNLKTGAQLASDLLADVDRKADDGHPLQGVFRAQTGGGVSSAPGECYDATGQWAVVSPAPNCGGASLL